MVGGRLAFGLDEEGQLFEILSVPARERLQQLQALAGRRNVHGQLIAFLGRRHEPFLAFGKPLRRQLLAHRRLELEFLAIRALEFLVDRVEPQVAGEGIGRHDFGTCQK